MSKRGKKTGHGCFPYFSGFKEELEFFRVWGGRWHIFYAMTSRKVGTLFRTACHAEFGADLAMFIKPLISAMLEPWRSSFRHPFVNKRYLCMGFSRRTSHSLVRKTNRSHTSDGKRNSITLPPPELVFIPLFPGMKPPDDILIDCHHGSDGMVGWLMASKSQTSRMYAVLSRERCVKGVLPTNDD